MQSAGDKTLSSLNLAVIGNCNFSALLDSRARIVWSCLPRFDSDPRFCALLNDHDESEKGIFDVELVPVEVTWATAIAAMVQTSVLLLLLSKKHDIQVIGEALSRGWKALPCVAAMAVSVGGVLLVWSGDGSWAMTAIRLVVCVALGAVVYTGVAWAIGYRELAQALQRRRQSDGH